MADLNLKVDPESLKKQAGLVESAVKNMRQNVTSMVNEIDSMRKYWKGDASEYQYRQFSQLVESVNRMNDTLGEYPVDLLKLANLYEKTEDLNKQEARKTKTSITMGRF
ncbi:WXG100 family type VII secretion target [Pseudobutyrivibrio sp.]|uniref:WXG100 family type VII secretion target n=1 Tax=Pseudobutyrivibrio sp. TaxID=2014367 RepID=UPI001DD08D7C|nr:WXG100 family type VII secretion target [Pseudobutyrivibrio sp.]MBE5912015.1 WXG100 family type VII secretion target [Pseudobutyrivibrio sp.]